MSINFFSGKLINTLVPSPLIKISEEAYWNEKYENKIISSNSSENDMTIIAHRGLSSIAPENTIPAFEAAAQNGFTTVECDIEWTKDNVPVILHDATINRTARKSNGSRIFLKKNCNDCTYKELQKYDFGSWFGKDFKGTKIPSFEELIQCCKENNLNVYVEIKDNKVFDKEKAQLLIDMVNEAGFKDNVTWISFNDNYLEIIKDINPEARLGYLSQSTITPQTIETLENLQTNENDVFLDAKYSIINESTSHLLEDAGFDFEAWTVDNAKDLEKLYYYDCQGITTNNLTEEDIEAYYDKLKE